MYGKDLIESAILSSKICQTLGKKSPNGFAYELFLDEKGKKDLKGRFLSPGLQYGDVKKELYETIIEYFRPFRKKREYLSGHMDYVYEQLLNGSNKASAVADQILSKVRKVTGLNYKV